MRAFDAQVLAAQDHCIDLLHAVTTLAALQPNIVEWDNATTAKNVGRQRRRAGSGWSRYWLNPTLLSPRQSPHWQTCHLADYRGLSCSRPQTRIASEHSSISTRIQGIGVGSGVGEVGFVGEIVGNGKGEPGGNGFGVMGGGEVGRIGGAGFGTPGAL